MTRSVLFCIFALAACGDNLAPDAPEDAGPRPPASPTADGEYAITITQDSFACQGETAYIPPIHEIADVIPQADPWKFDLLSRPAHVLDQWDDYYRYDVTWDNTGFFENDRFDPLFIEGAEAERFIAGSVDDDSLYFFHHFDVGYHSDDGTWNSVCVYNAEANGMRRYAPWDGRPRTSIDGEWRVKKTVLDSPLSYPATLTHQKLKSAATKTPTYELMLNVVKKHFDPLLSMQPNNLRTDMEATDTKNHKLPYAHFVTMDTVAQDEDGSYFYLDGTYQPQSWYVNRDPNTGAVDAYALQITLLPAVNQTWLMETKLTGTLLPDSLNLEYSWKWTVAETGEVVWYQHELYEGVPRYNAHDPNLAEPPIGVYNSTYALLPNDCGYPPYTENRLLDILPAEDGIIARMTDFGSEPVAAIGSDNSVSFTFDRHRSDGSGYSYWVNGTIDGHNLNLTMDITATDSNGQYQCAATYQITGNKRFESYR